MIKKNLVSIIIPVYNEENYIENCLNSVLQFEKPSGIDFEIIIGDGRSNDKTVLIIKNFQKVHKNITLFDNPKRYQSFAMNIALKYSKGFYILRLDAHSKYPKDYLKLCYESLNKNDADNAGGIFCTMAGSKTFSGKIVQAISTHKFGVGDASFRTEEIEGEADTVPFGFYKRDLFNKIGFFDERLVRCQDYEFNRRIIASGGKIWRNPKIKVFYYNQPSLYKFLIKQLYVEAPYNPYLWYVAPYAFSIRHGITGLFALGFIVGLILLIFNFKLKIVFILVMIIYFILSIISSLQQSIRYSDFKLFPFLSISFFLFHFIHGIGVLKGIIKLIFKRSPVQKSLEPWENANRFYGLKDYNDIFA